MTKKNTVLLLCAVLTMGLSGCANDTGTPEEATLVEADESGREAGFSYYEVSSTFDPQGFEVRIFDGMAAQLGEVTLAEDELGTHTRMSLTADPRVADIFQTREGFTLHFDGTEAVRVEGGELVAGGAEELADAELFVGTLGSLEQDQNLMQVLRDRRLSEQAAVCAPIATMDEAGDIDDGGMTDGGGLVFEQADGCGYWGCVWKVIKAEAAIAVIAAAIAAAGTVCAAACAATVGAACIACVAGALGGGTLALDAALVNICDACRNGCIPGCERWDCR